MPGRGVGPGEEGPRIFVGSGGAGRVLCLMTRFVVPDLPGPGVLGDGGEEDDGGLVVVSRVK